MVNFIPTLSGVGKTKQRPPLLKSRVRALCEPSAVKTFASISTSKRGCLLVVLELKYVLPFSTSKDHCPAIRCETRVQQPFFFGVF